jgi:hypothetical protein
VGRDSLKAKAALAHWDARQDARAMYRAQRPQDVQPKAVCPQALLAALQLDSLAGSQALEDEWVLLRAQPGLQASLPVAPLQGPPQALWVQPAQRPERLPLEQLVSRSALLE